MKVNFICFSINNWEKRWARKQQFMYHLAKHKAVEKVLYIEPAVTLKRLAKNLFSSETDEENHERLKRALLFKCVEYAENLFVFTPIFFLPLGRFAVIHKINWIISLVFVHHIILRLKLRNNVLWLYNPYDFCILNLFKKRLLSCFDWAEKWSEFYINVTEKERDRINSLENRLVKNVNIVFTASQELVTLAKKHNPKSYFLPNGTDTKLFKTANKSLVPKDIIKIAKPIVGYIGTITERLNIDLLLFLVEKLTRYSFVFIGDIHRNRVDISCLVSKKNCHFLGGKRYQMLPNYLNMFDVCILPYHPELTKAEPTKVYDYLAAGKPIVSTPVAEMHNFIDYIDIAENNLQFEHQIEMAISKNDIKKEQCRIRFVEKNSWALRVEEILNKIEELKVK